MKMMRRAQCAVCLAMLAVALVWLTGASSAGSAPSPKPAKSAPDATATSWKTARPSLPDWAPKHPSPEFVRAARVLKPMPLDIMKSPGRTDAENAARMKGATIMWPAAYEFFGTLSDEQIERFLRTQQVVVPPDQPGKPPTRMKGSQVLIPVKQLTKKRRAALDHYFDAWREAWKGQSVPGKPELNDCLLMLYKRGAKSDLSNVAAGFDTAECDAGHFVSVLFRVTKRDGTTNGFGSSFAQI